MVLALSLLLAWISSGFVSMHGWTTFLLTGLLCLVLVAGGWWLIIKTENTKLPRRLMGLLLLAIFLRLGAGLLWYIGLPALGHGSPAEQGGYVMADAFQRDQVAWKLAQSEKPLWRAFRNQCAVDQYGGMLFVSTAIYRYTGGTSHYPLQIVLLAAAASALAIPFTWAFSRRIWDEKVAWVAAWFLALFPEAVLLGSSQMREAFTITLTAMAFYGLIGYLQERATPYLVWALAAILLFLPFSPPFAAFLVVLLLLTAFFYNFPGLRRSMVSGRLLSGRKWIVIGVVLLMVVIGVRVSLGQFTPEKISNPIGVLNWWFQKSADWQAYLTERASGMIQYIFDRTPQWSHATLLLAYGVAQPFLPAALVVTSKAPIWQGIAIWRALGWTFLLIMLIYATFRAWLKESNTLTRILVVLIWLTILVASFRGGGDQWDNPRYRLTFVSIQVAVAAWAWVEQRRTGDRIFRYALIWVLLNVLWFTPWYLLREFHFPWSISDPLKTLALGTITAVLVILWDWARGETVSEE